MIKALADADKKDDDDEDEEEEEDKEKAEEEEKKDDDEVSKYETFWKAFGKYIKMGLIEDAANRTRLAKLLRYTTSKSGDKEISLEDYVANMQEDQKNIYYISGEDKKKRDEQYKEMFKPLLDYTKELLGKKVEKVQISKHLVNSPVVVLSADYGWTAQMEKVMKSQAFAEQSKFEFMKSKRMFEVNPRHPMIVELNSRIKEKPEGDEQLTDMVTSLYLSAVISAGYQLMPEDAN